MAKIKFLQAKEKFNSLYKNKDFLEKSIVLSSGGGIDKYSPQRYKQ
jgi:hypothetical protein